MQERRNSFDYEELLACGRGELFPEGPQLPLPPMLMFDRISEIAEAGGEHGPMRGSQDDPVYLWITGNSRYFACYRRLHGGIEGIELGGAVERDHDRGAPSIEAHARPFRVRGGAWRSNRGVVVAQPPQVGRVCDIDQVHTVTVPANYGRPADDFHGVHDVAGTLYVPFFSGAARFVES